MLVRIHGYLFILWVIIQHHFILYYSNYSRFDHWEHLQFDILQSLWGLFLFCMWVCQVSLVVTDSCDPVDYSLPGSSVHGVLQSRILEWVTTLSFRGSYYLGIEPTSLRSPALPGGFFFFLPLAPPGKPHCCFSTLSFVATKCLGSSCIFPLLVMESATSPRILGSFHWIMLFQNKIWVLDCLFDIFLIS